MSVPRWHACNVTPAIPRRTDATSVVPGTPGTYSGVRAAWGPSATARLHVYTCPPFSPHHGYRPRIGVRGDDLTPVRRVDGVVLPNPSSSPTPIGDPGAARLPTPTPSHRRHLVVPTPPRHTGDISSYRGHPVPTVGYGWGTSFHQPRPTERCIHTYTYTPCTPGSPIGVGGRRGRRPGRRKEERVPGVPGATKESVVVRLSPQPFPRQFGGYATVSERQFDAGLPGPTGT